MEKNNFLEKLDKMVSAAKAKGNTLTMTEISNNFMGDDLNPDQMEQIYAYLETREVDIVPEVPDENMITEAELLMSPDDDDDDRFLKDIDEEDIDLEAIDLLDSAASDGGRGTGAGQEEGRRRRLCQGAAD